MKNPPGSGIIVGMDEAGRGAWAGPVVAAAVHIPKGVKLTGLDDSKKLTEQQREILFKKITDSCDYGIGWATHTEVDEHGLLHATYLAFSRALQGIPVAATHLFVDGKDKWSFKVPHTTVIRGDQTYRCIAAASILAKVSRDHWMTSASTRYPDYGFEIHKGYGTERHQKALQEKGVSTIHRISYAPLQNLLNPQESLF